MFKKSLFIIFICLTLLIVSATFVFASEKALPADAAPDQILYYPLQNESGSYLDFMKTIYNCLQGGAHIVQESLMGFNKDLEVVPLGVESWEVSEDGLHWTFHLRRELKWSDGEPVTAQDYVFALHRAVEQGYDFSWYWRSAAGIKNWNQVEKGELAVKELGIKALDEYTLVITTEVPKPYLLGVLVWLYPVPQHAVKKYGDEYATRAETMVCNGPFQVSEWVKGSHLTCIQNPYYHGQWSPYLQKIILKYGTFEPEIGFPAYLNGEIDRSDLNPGQLAYVRKNLPDQLYSWPQFLLYYLSFDTTKPPFDQIKVRQAFNYALNREEMCSTVLKDLAIPEYSLLMKGFPGYDPIWAKNILEYNKNFARKLLAEAGYPEGKGFPKLEMWIRQADQYTAWQTPAATYMQAHFKEVLGVDIIPRFIEAKTYTDALNQRTHNFFLCTYRFDYVDPSNFMDLFLTGGRHAWSNPEFDRLVREADSSQNWEKRIENYREAESILAEESPAVFAFQALRSSVWKPYLKGEALEPNLQGIVSWGNMRYGYTMTHIYIKKH
ncbi:MAG: peptide ABC transporter substrate-binding protein [Candidatus Atribacteria bacterium]|nr:peptide ABC transporter substrate-binding protein [Candidatus Atribacteria bacterium]